jgi:hypothetical protein
MLAGGAADAARMLIAMCAAWMLIAACCMLIAVCMLIVACAAGWAAGGQAARKEAAGWSSCVPTGCVVRYVLKGMGSWQAPRGVAVCGVRGSQLGRAAVGIEVKAAHAGATGGGSVATGGGSVAYDVAGAAGAAVVASDVSANGPAENGAAEGGGSHGGAANGAAAGGAADGRGWPSQAVVPA